MKKYVVFVSTSVTFGERDDAFKGMYNGVDNCGM